MHIDELKAAIERRGFLIRLWLPEEDRVKMIVMLADRSLPREVSTQDLMIYLEHGLSTANIVEQILGRLTRYQHIVCCKQCHELFLRCIDQEFAVRYYQRYRELDMSEVDETRLIHIMTRINAGVTISLDDAEILPGTYLKEALERATRYRSAKAGPCSPALARCPTCQLMLTYVTTEEIKDE